MPNKLLIMQLNELTPENGQIKRQLKLA